nr:zf-CCHC domain-containing protein/UBN2 domain-containing protein [Tanacetum cinerariifolium]
MVLYNALPKKEYKIIFMCKTAKDIWQSLLITHQSNSQVKDNKINLLVQQYEQFTILEEESIDSGFARFNTIITSLKALDEGFSSKNYVRKFVRSLHPKWRSKVTAIEESKYLSSLALDELIGTLKVHELVMENDSEIYRGKKEIVKSIALKAKKGSSDDETSTSGSDDEEYAMVVRNFNFFRRKEDKTNDETCLMAQSSNEVCLRTCLEPNEWIKDSGCSKHMTGNKSLFSTYKAYDEESLNVTFDESPPSTKLSQLVDDDVGEEEAIRKNIKIRTPSPPPRKEPLSPPQAPSKSISSKNTHYTSSSSPSESLTPTHVAPPPKLHFVIPIKLEPQELPPPKILLNDLYAQTMDNWPSGPFNPSPPPHVSRPPLGFPNPPPGFEPLPSTQPLFVNINNNTTLLHNNAPLLENIHHPPLNLGNQDFPNPLNILNFVHPNDMHHLHNMLCHVVAPQGMKSKCSETVSTTCSHTFDTTSALHHTHPTFHISRITILPHPSDYMGKC